MQEQEGAEPGAEQEPVDPAQQAAAEASGTAEGEDAELAEGDVTPEDRLDEDADAADAEDGEE